eukprot:2159448-Prymnesium_polylepis.2
MFRRHQEIRRRTSSQPRLQMRERRRALERAGREALEPRAQVGDETLIAYPASGCFAASQGAPAARRDNATQKPAERRRSCRSPSKHPERVAAKRGGQKAISIQAR